MTQQTYVVTMPQEREGDLAALIERLGGHWHTWDLVLGDYGHLHHNISHPELLMQVRYHLAEQEPELECPEWAALATEARIDICEVATGSYGWMMDGRFDDEEIPDLIEAARHHMLPRQPWRPDNVNALTQFVAQLTALDPRARIETGEDGWHNMSPVTRTRLADIARHDPLWGAEQQLTETGRLLARCAAVG